MVKSAPGTPLNSYTVMYRFMSAGGFFWLFSVLTLAALAAVLTGYTTLPVAVTLLLISVILLRISVNPSKGIGSIRSELGGRLASLENSFSGLNKSVDEIKSGSELTLGTLDRFKNDLQGEMKIGLDRMAERLIDFENGMNQMKRTFSAAVASLDDRVRVMEPRFGGDGSQLGPMPSNMEVMPETEEYIELDKQGI